MFVARRTLTITTLISFVLTGFAATVHFHPPVTTQNVPPGAPATCSCIAHSDETGSKSAPGSPCDHDSDHCLLCKFIAESSLNQDSQDCLSEQLFRYRDQVPADLRYATDRLAPYQGRAPPRDLLNNV